MIRQFYLLVVLSISVAMGLPAISQQPTYVDSTYPMMSGNVGYETTFYPATMTTYSFPSPSNVVYPTSPSGTFATYQSAAAPVLNVPSYTTTSSTAVAASGLAQQKAQQMAQRNMRGHVGGGLGGANYEGVGWSTFSAQHAIQQCCYWGQRPVSQIGVSRGSDGSWYACVLYR